jgi:hypothetical protein
VAKHGQIHDPAQELVAEFRKKSTFEKEGKNETTREEPLTARVCKIQEYR